MGGSIDTLPGRARPAAKAVNELRQAFDELSKSGTVNFQTFEHFGLTLLRFSPVAAAGGLAVLGLASAVGELYKWTQKQNEADLASQLARVKSEADHSTSAFEAYYKSILAGEGEAIAKLRERLSLQMSAEADVKAQNDLRLQGLDKESMALETLKGHLTSGLNADRAWNEERKAALNIIGLFDPALRKDMEANGDAAISVDDLNKTLAQNKKDRDAIIQSMKDEVVARQKLLAPTEEQIKDQKELNKSQDYYVDGLPVNTGLTKEQAQALNDEAEAATEAAYGITDLAGAQQRMAEANMAAQSSFVSLASFLANGFSPIAKTAFDDYTIALYDMLHAQQVSTHGIIKALGDQVKGSIKHIGEDASVHALYEGAMALASFAIGDTAGGALHAMSSAEFTIVAAAAGVAVAAIGGKDYAGGWTAPKQGSAGGGGSTGAGGGMGGKGQGTGGDINVTVIGQIDAAGLESLVDQINAATQQRSLGH